MNHLFKSRKTCPSNELTHTWQLAWTDKTNSSYSCSKHQQIRQSIQMPLADRLLLIQHAQYKIMTTSTYTISTNKVPISLAEFVKVLPTCEYMLIQGLSTLGGLILSIQRFHLWGLQLDIYHNKLQQYQWRYFHYTSIFSQWRPTSFKDTLLINLAFSQNYKQQMKLYSLEYYYIKLWQSHAPSSKS